MHWLLILILLLSTSTISNAQYWMQKAGGNTIDEAYDVAVDVQGNVFSVGYFTGISTFGGSALVASGSTDAFITKVDNQGNFVWAFKGGGSGSDRANAVATDGLGNSYVTGYFNGTATFGGTSLTSNGLQDIFIAKYNSAGVVQWAKKAGGTQSDFGFGIAVNSSGDVFVTGAFKDSATFGGTSVLSANTTSDVFVTKLNSAGVFQWTKKGVGNFPNLGRSIGVDNGGNVYLTGQFSDTITFDVQHNNQMQNVIFLIKYDGAGAEQWFRVIGGATSNVAHDLAADNNGNTYLTGDFEGSLTFYGTPNTVISSTYLKTIFIAKYDNSGTVINAEADGSDNDITSQSIAIDGSGNYYIGGHYKCDLGEYKANYGAANFNAVGGFDVFVSKYNSAGVWQYSRNIGSREEDKCYGVGVDANGQIHAVGSFKGDLNVPVSTNFIAVNLTNWTDVSCTGNSPYCNDPDYGSYYMMGASGNSDIFILNGFDANREPYDYYKRTGAVCDKSILEVCIDSLCPDTVKGCGAVQITAISPYCDDIGPETSLSWSSNSISVSTTGSVSVTQTTADGCFQSSDSIYVVIDPLPTAPQITDGKGINVNATVTNTVDLCLPDTTKLTGSGFNVALRHWWSGPGLGAGVFDTVVVVSATGTYTFHVENGTGCDAINQVFVRVNPPLPPFILKIFVDDTVEVCSPDPFIVMLYDSVSNPSATSMCLSSNSYSFQTTWTVNPVIPYLTSCDTYNNFTAPTTGTYTVSAMVIRFNTCFSDTFNITKDVYVIVNPKPIIPPFTVTITGNLSICPGGSVVLTASGGPNYLWSGTGVHGITDSVVTVTAAGGYTVISSLYDTNSFGCTSNRVENATVMILGKAQPIITASDLVICPNSTVTLSSNQLVGNFWEGPNGPITGGSVITVTDPGQYFTVVNDADSCGLVSNTITLQQYTTPMLTPVGDTFICNGDSTMISVQATNNSVVQWQPPLSGSNLTQVIHTAGTYTCKITSCGIETFASITIYSGSSLAHIIASGPLCKDSTITLSGLPGVSSYLWLPGNDTNSSIQVSNSGTYILSIIDTAGCTASDTVIINEISVPASITSTALSFCDGDSLTLTGNAGMTNYLWSPTGDTTDSITTTQPGVFSLTVTDSTGCQASAGPVTVTVSDTFMLVTQTGNSLICEGESVILSAANANMNRYLWLPGNDTTASISVTQSGTYILQTTDAIGCIAFSDSFQIAVKANNLQEPTISNDTLICGNSEILLIADAGTDTVYWYNPLTDPYFHKGDTLMVKPTETTIYYVRTEDLPCVSNDASVTVTTEDCENPIVSNVFSPNGDGINDYFNIEILGATCFNIKVYNRWGVLIFFTEFQEISWDGRIHNSPEEAPDGVYYYIVDYCRVDGENGKLNGYITLVR